MKKLTNTQCLKAIAEYLEKMTGEFIAGGEPFLAASSLARESQYLRMYGLEVDMFAERNGKKCGQISVKPYPMMVSKVINGVHHDHFECHVDWDVIRAFVRTTVFHNKTIA